MIYFLKYHQNWKLTILADFALKKPRQARVNPFVLLTMQRYNKIRNLSSVCVLISVKSPIN